jgi:hypothetical protein
MSNKYCISDRVNILGQALNSNKSKVAFLLGAGCPLSVCIEDKPLIPDIAGLTKDVYGELSHEQQQLAKKIKDGKGTIEDILSRVRLLIEAIDDEEFKGLRKTDLEDMERAICEKITAKVDKELPNDITSYHNLASWISGIPREYPIEIFTPNYDLLIESSLESKGIPYFDGFIGSRSAFFDLHSMEHEELPARWVRLWKLHGSVNWWLDENGRVFRGTSKKQEGGKQMIYPSHLKYSQSRRMPYLAMQDRLSNFLSKGQSVLVTSGYSFVDQHLNEIIIQRLSANPRAVCFGLLYGNIEEYPDALKCAQKAMNLHLISKNAAFFAGEQKNWEEKDDNPYNYLEERENNTPICKIGDFAFLCKFLLKQTGDYITEEKGEN